MRLWKMWDKIDPKRTEIAFTRLEIRKLAMILSDPPERWDYRISRAKAMNLYQAACCRYENLLAGID